jgi:hypothetical protein
LVTSALSHLFIGGWEVRDAQSRGIPHLLIVPALILTFLFGPAGLLLYLAIRGSRRAVPGLTSHINGVG